MHRNYRRENRPYFDTLQSNRKEATLEFQLLVEFLPKRGIKVVPVRLSKPNLGGALFIL